jgi:hypothetical protein
VPEVLLDVLITNSPPRPPFVNVQPSLSGHTVVIIVADDDGIITGIGTCCFTRFSCVLLFTGVYSSQFCSIAIESVDCIFRTTIDTNSRFL